MIVFWFRRDLRMHDNAGLAAALASGQPVLPLFVYDTDILDQLPKDDHRLAFIHQLLERIQSQLQKHGKALATFHGKPIDVFKKLRETHGITAIYTNRDYEPAARERDKAIYEWACAEKIEYKSFKDQVIFERSEIVKDDGSPYVVYTPYSKRWLSVFENKTLETYQSDHTFEPYVAHSFPFLGLADIGFTEPTIKIEEPNTAASLIDAYGEQRNFPAVKATSKLSPHLRFGSVSIRELVQKANKSADKTFLKELIWREFFMMILYHYPHTVTKSFKPAYDRIEWRNNEEEFKSWCEGKTGFPMVDAGMRELNRTGWMHNRVRLVVASFLCKHLLIDWRWGEAYFALKLSDYEQSSNVGNWQWAAGSGVDAAPYFRIFNPAEQIKKFDPKLVYCKRNIPELETTYYPSPIVDHKTARDRCLQVYKAGLES
ncbi:deoxyribodipyrimidine photo-lyase [Flavobacterium sp.]|uniref:cryptochrome/photolyase family protein n=1 Tax=Flavobacterium sp. TaxID=239 RepID=UPI002632CF83|nr:deoxyribodipyrimidine photo-lyase [Flavobacterium sp.]